MEILYQRFIRLNRVKAFLDKAAKDSLFSVTGFAGAKPLICLAIIKQLKSNIIYLAEDDHNKNSLYSDLLSFLPSPKIILFNPAESNEFDYLNSVRNNTFQIIIIKKEDLLTLVPEVKVLSQYQMRLRKDMDLPIGQLLEFLENSQYERVDLVSEPCEYAVRGSIVDVFPNNQTNPIRIEFVDNKIESLRYFDTLSQRSIALLNEIEFYCRVKPEDLKERLIDILPKSSVIISEVSYQNDYQEVFDCFAKCIFLTNEKGDFNFNFYPPPQYFKNLRLLKSEIDASHLEYFIVVPYEYQRERLMRVLGNQPQYLLGSLSLGMLALSDNLCVIAERELFGQPIVKLPKRKFKGQPLDDLLALNKGDYVVHIDYGIGQFAGIKRIKVDDVEKDFLLIHYAQGQKLYVPVENLSLIERYIGVDDSLPTLSRIGTKSWLLTKLKAAKAAQDYAQELINIYAKRIVATKTPLSQDELWQTEFEATFPFEETPDQLKTLAEVKRDMESVKPMERLVCGDTGFGKTEIALRAAFKAVTNLKQVCVLVPTTILCYQHYNTFKKRFVDFPFRIEMLSKFISKTQQEKIIADLRNGKVDIIIGTHMLLNPKIAFKDLGLLIIDEEQKFGVKQKEMIKKLKSTVDVLMLTATPIPRTLYKALVGISDISPIHTPPVGRKDIITEVTTWNNEFIYQRIQRELSRQGQVLFIHNRIESIKDITRRLYNLNPNWRIAVAHSKLSEKALAEIYLNFLDKKYDILVATAIMESGLDMPNVNTIIINRAHEFGIADLHQLRGRVGRSDKQGFCILIIPDKEVTETAKKRIATILAYSQLGAGFRLAMRDMEIRGVGNILGSEQHGHIAGVGFTLYQQMLKEAIAKLQGEATPTEPELSLDVSAYIPETYINDAYERVAIYKRLLSLENEGELKLIKEELKDRFGKYPDVIENLFIIAEIRLKAKALNLLKVSLKNNQITLVRLEKTFTTYGNINTLLRLLSQHLK
ncbi:MAG: transcription-repair coupling factor [candidate division WOR-3 bacterium]|nr:transcription-repair coupling factor [candidate division WOR-3 bacterium]